MQSTQKLAYALLTRLAPALPGAAPKPAERFREDGAGYLLRSYLPGEALDQYRERKDGCVSILAKGRALFPEITPLSESDPLRPG